MSLTTALFLSVTCVLSKILERIIVGRLFDHFHSNNILHPAQHGFIKHRSTSTNLLESYNDWSISIQSREQMTIVYIDFTKAFDLVSHPKLFAKLHSYGVRGVVLQWLQNFFTGRSLQTKIDSSLSDIADLISGVVQGIGVGPLMFLIYINKLVSVLEHYNIKVKLFADDVKMYITILDDMDVQRLQFALDALVQWSDTWQLPISINKCCLLNIGKNTCDTVVNIGGCTLPVVNHTRDLGITVSSDLSPSLHVTDIVSKAHIRACLILRAFMSRNIHLLKRAFLVYVRPIVEHNSVIWSPYTARDIDAVESVQRRFTKRLPTLRNMSYNDRLRYLNIPSLELRRLHTDLFWCYKVVFRLVLVSFDDLFVFSPCQVTRGHAFKLFKRQNTHCVRANFFSERVINCWNSLPDSVDFSSFTTFRRTVKQVDFSRFLRH